MPCYIFLKVFTHKRFLLYSVLPSPTLTPHSLYCAAGLALAMARDGSSGGVIRTAVITEEGVQRSVFTGPEIPKFYSD